MLILERGGLNFRNAVARLKWEQVDRLEEVARAEPPAYRSPMRLMVAVVWARTVRLRLGYVFLMRRVGVPSSDLRWSANAAEALALAKRFAAEGGGPNPPTRIDVGHLLLALASSPGSHLRLVDGGNVIACAARRELGLDRWHHRLVLTCDRAKLSLRRWAIRLDREVSTHGRLSLWGAIRAANALAGLLVAAFVLPITLFANLILYIFLWPASLLMAGLRAISGAALGYQTTNHRWHEIPGGELGLGGVKGRISDRRIAALVLLPRLLALLLSVAAMTILVWRSQRLGVITFPTLFARPDIVSGGASEAFWLAPALLFLDMLEQNGTLAGIGLLAGAGLGFMSMPTYRELNLIRLYAGHEIGLGSRLARHLTLPASILTGAIACIEAILPFRNGPIYLTVYLVPMAFSLMLAGILTALLPY